MGLLDTLKQALVRTPFERPLHRARQLVRAPRSWGRPELRDLHGESDRIEAGLRRLLEPDSNCIDVGCHFGSFLSLLLRLSPRGKHTAFEALPEKVLRLRKKFPEVEIVEGAAGEAAGEVEFLRNRSNSGFSGTAATAGNADGVERLRVPAVRLDDTIPADRRVALIKIDVEGAELSVLKGARSLALRSRPVVLFECVGGNLTRAGLSRRDVYDFVTGELRMRLYLPKEFAAGPALTLDDFCEATTYPFKARNFFAAPAEMQPS